MAKLGFGELELSILTSVKKLGRVTVRDVYINLGSAGSYTTIMTVMSRLAEKGELTREKQGKQYIYWVSSKNEAPSKGILKRIQNKIFSGNSAAMVCYLLEESEKISNKELEEIETIIQKRRLENKK